MKLALKQKINYLLSLNPNLRQLFSISLIDGFHKINCSLDPLSSKQLAIITNLVELLADKPSPPLRLALFIFAQSQNAKLPAPTGAKRISEAINRTTIKLVAKQPEIVKQINKIILADCRLEIRLLPYFFYQALKSKSKKIIDPQLLIPLGKLNLLYWSTYTLIDDIIDGQQSAKLLPLALEQLGLINKIQLDLRPGPELKIIIDQITTGLNQSQLNIPNKIEELANRSLAHAIGPLFILDKLKVDFRPWLNFAQNYLSLRQLHDDIVDQAEDQIANNFNYFNQELNRDINQTKIEITKLSQKAIASLNQIKILENKDYFFNLIKRYNLTKLKPREAKEFLRYYHRIKKAASG